ncbi:MAG: NYN domain-containing protein [Candidatus Methanoplasma sp.]|jgi:uncharacterized LabA/DUF88 family protein|nr:NYN domain-containing protein [Candidatus Methanoplasma sp.]
MTTIKRNETDRVMVFIDIANIEASLNENGKNGSTVDYKGLVEQIVGSRTLAAAYVFDACCGEDSRLRRMRRVTGNPGFRPVMLRYNPNKSEQKGVDMAMGLKMFDEASKDRFDTAVVVSGDADFIPAMEYVQAAGKMVETAAFSWSANDDIRSASDAYTVLDDLCIICLKETHAHYTEGATMHSAQKTRMVA